MFGINSLLKDVNGMIDYYEMLEFISFLVNEDAGFDKRINNLDNYMKEKMENAALYLYYKVDKTIIDIEFLNKYNKHILKLINNDIKNVLNNNYCYNILSLDYNKCDSDEDIIKIFNMSFKKIFNKLDNELDKISNKLLSGIELSDDEKIFYENNILFTVSNQIIYNEDNDEILKYFNKYPINNIEKPKNRKLYLVHMILKNSDLLGENICITFNDDIEVDNNKVVTFGRIGKLPDGRSIIEINNTDIYNIKNDYEFYQLIFTLLHELGHLNQDVNYDKYSDYDKKRMDMENKLRNIDSDFYLNYHDNFFIEQDANMYAIKRMLNEFNDNYETLNICRKKAIQLEKVYNEDNEFCKLEREEYNKRIYGYSNNNLK